MSTIVPIPGKPGWYAVSVGGGTYEVCLATGHCTCPSACYRTPVTGRACKHWTALAQCPACEGRGVLALRCQYADSTPIPCAACSATGRRRAEADAAERDAELRKVFA